MTKLGWFWTFLIVLVYGLTASKLIQSDETIISKHPLFIYSVVVLIFTGGESCCSIQVTSEQSPAISI